ncbi:hypothetical protein [Scytonema sp. NUACC26]|uniref:nSTAND1 domain-containing NTPase n=1 Tax=Scytonema sp. NUACC26 TaxID=3140176 RepID=UPI0038B3D30D
MPPNPYQGLSAFGEEDAAFFFGRETFVNSLFEAGRGNRQSAKVKANENVGVRSSSTNPPCMAIALLHLSTQVILSNRSGDKRAITEDSPLLQ